METCQACEQSSPVLCPDGYDADCCDVADHDHSEPGECGCAENRLYGTCGH